MHCARFITTVFLVLIHAQARQLKANSLWPSWLKEVNTSGGVECRVEKDCVVGSGLGSCFVRLDALRVPAPLGSTDQGNNVEFINVPNGSARGTVQRGHGHYTYPPASPEVAISAIDILGRSPEAHWNLCWTSPIFLGGIKPWGSTYRRDLRGASFEHHCY